MNQGGYQPRNNEGYRPRYNNNMEGKPNYQDAQGGYQPRNNQGYQPRNNGYQPRQGGYQPRQGYQPRNNYNSNYNGGGYRQPYNNGENMGSYTPNQGGYQPRQGGYQPRQGYQPRNNYNQGYRPQGFRPRTADYDPTAKYSMKKRIEYREDHIDPTLPVRLNKFLANAGVCSRREADEYIQAGRVTVNGEVVTELGTKVMRTDEIKFGENLVSLEK